MLIAGGGTGGHLYPGVALAEEVTTRQKGNEVLFVGTARGIEARVIPELGYPLELIEVVGIKNTGLAGLLKGLFRIPGAVFASRRIVSRFKPDIAVGVGGYASGPALVAAWLMGVPSVVLEQNTIPGFTNRVLARFFAKSVYVSFEKSIEFFPREKAHFFGNPIRRQLLDNFLEARRTNEKFTVLVLGGSQGAHAVNMRMVDAARSLAALGLRIVHQTGEKDREDVARGYAEAGADADVKAFIKDMSAAYREADLVVARAGATTIAELLVAKKASILIPFPHAADNHQEWNARALVDVGAAKMFVESDLDGAKLSAEIKALFVDREALARMEQAAGRAGRPEAAREIVDACFELTKGARS